MKSSSGKGGVFFHLKILKMEFENLKEIEFNEGVRIKVEKGGKGSSGKGGCLPGTAQHRCRQYRSLRGEGTARSAGSCRCRVSSENAELPRFVPASCLSLAKGEGSDFSERKNTATANACFCVGLQGSSH